MKKLILVLVVLMLAAVAAQADPVLDTLQTFILEVATPDALGTMLVTASDATGAGVLASWQLRDWPVFLDVGIIRSSNETTDVVAGGSLNLGLKGSVNLRLGIARVPEGYGGTRILGLELDHVGLYFMLGKAF